jgi:acetyltransferase-like isoleucine patch superfamily enzyme
MCGKASIGAFCSIADRVEIFTGGGHRTDFVTSFPLRNRWDLPGRDFDLDGLSRGDVVIGNDVWLCTGAWIMSGVTVGHGAVVAARSVVTRDVRPYAVVAGSPAREVRRRFNDEIVDRLLAERWWDWPDEMIRDQVDVLLAPPKAIMRPT